MIQVTCAIIFQNGRILVTQRGMHKSHPGLWEFPGGKTEPGESPEECIIRELYEELKIHVRLKERLKDCYFDYGNYQINLLPFIAEFVSGDITLTEHKNFAWVKPEELKNFNWVPADMRVLEIVSGIL